MEHSSEECIFCKIVRGEIPADIIYQDDLVMAFRDIQPAAPKHVLIIPRKHIASFEDFSGDDGEIASRIMLAAPKVAEKIGLTDTGYRFVFNNGPDALQSVGHIHGHLVGGIRMGWPPFPGGEQAHG